MGGLCAIALGGFGLWRLMSGGLRLGGLCRGGGGFCTKRHDPRLVLCSKRLGLCESSFLQLEYSIEYLIEYSSTRWIPEIAINHRVVQNKWIPGYSFKFLAYQRFEMSQNYCIKLKNKPNDLTKHNYSSENITDCFNLLVNRHRNL